MPSARFVQAALNPNSAECACYLLTLTHASFPAVQRFCTGGVDITSNSRAFLARGLDLAPPGESAELGARRGRIRIDDADRVLTPLLRAVTTRVVVDIEIVLAAYPNDIELSWPGLEADLLRGPDNAVELEIGPRDDSVDTFPVQAFTPANCPGLF